MRDDSQVTILEMAKRLGITTRAIEKQIFNLKKDGKVKRIGGAKGGHWEVMK